MHTQKMGSGQIYFYVHKAMLKSSTKISLHAKPSDKLPVPQRIEAAQEWNMH